MGAPHCISRSASPPRNLPASIVVYAPDEATATLAGELADLRDSVERTLDALRELGRLEVVDAWLVETCRAVTAAVCIDPTNAALWRQSISAMEQLREVTSDDSGDDAMAGILAKLSAAVSDEASA